MYPRLSDLEFARYTLALLAVCIAAAACGPAHQEARRACEAVGGCNGPQADSAAAVRIALETFAAMEIDSAALRVVGFTRTHEGHYRIALAPLDSMVVGGGGVIVVDRDKRVVSIAPEQ